MKVVVEHGELASVDLQGIPVPGEGEHQPLGTGALHVPRLDTRRESAKGQGPPTGFPLDRRTRELDVGDGPLLLRVAPQRKGDGAPAEHLILPFSGEDVLELDVTEKCLRFGDEIVDRLMTVAAALDDDLLGGSRSAGAPTRQRQVEPRLLPASNLLPRREPLSVGAAASAAGAGPHRSASAQFHHWRRPSSHIQQRTGTVSTSRVSAARRRAGLFMGRMVAAGGAAYRYGYQESLCVGDRSVRGEIRGAR